MKKVTKLDKILKLSTILGGVLFVLTLTLQVALTNKFAVKGIEMESIFQRREVLARDVSNLELELSKISAMGNLESKATELGFVDYESQISVISSSSYAANIR